jgi:hypothetical protein
MIVELMIIQSIDQMNIRIDEMNFEMDFEIDQMIDFKIVVRKDALYVENLNVDQRIISKRSEMTRKSVFSIDTLNSRTLIAFVSTF